MKRFQTRRSARSVGGCQRAASRYGDDIGNAMLKIACLRYKILRAKFGREPGPNDPLFFDSTNDQPLAAGFVEMRAQVRDAAAATRCDYTTVMKFLGLV